MANSYATVKCILRKLLFYSGVDEMSAHVFILPPPNAALLAANSALPCKDMLRDKAQTTPEGKMF